jgi:hypothetical protein
MMLSENPIKDVRDVIVYLSDYGDSVYISGVDWAKWQQYRDAYNNDRIRIKPMDFLTKLLEVTKTVESPTSFIRWAGYSAVATVLRDNVWIPFGARRTKIFPNLYVLIVGDSGETRKSTPLKIMNYLVKSVGNTKLIEGRASIQGVLKELANNKMTPNGTMLKDASGLLYSEELAAFLVGDPSALKILTDIYDYHEEHSIYLKGDDVVTLKNVVVNMISASNAAFLGDVFSKVDLYGGLVGRTILIVEEAPRHRDLGLRDNASEEDWKVLTDHLKRVSKFHGPAKLTDEAYLYLEHWYQQLKYNETSKTGFEPRMHTFVLKLAMIISACNLNRPFEGVITVEDVESAIQELATLRPNYFKILNSITLSTNTVAAASSEIMKILILNPHAPVEHASLMAAVFGKMDGDVFRKAIDTLLKMEFIDQIAAASVGKVAYQLTTKAMERFLPKLKSLSEGVN